MYMCNYTDVVWIGQPGVNGQLVTREAPGSTILIQWYYRATHHGVGVESVRHITRSTYEKREQRRQRDVSMQNVVRYSYVKGLDNGNSKIRPEIGGCFCC